MIIYRDYELDHKEIIALVSFEQEVEGDLMLSLYKNNTSADANIKASIDKVLHDKNLIHNERFLETGKYMEKFNDIIALKILECCDEMFVANLKSVNLRNNNYHREGYVKCDERYKALLSNYERVKDGYSDIRISQVHDLAYEKTKGKSKVDLKLEEKRFSIESDENWPLTENQIAKHIQEDFLNKIEEALDDSICYEDNRLRLRDNAAFFLDYLKKEKKYTKKYQQLEFQNETLFIDNTNFALEILTQYAIKILQDKIIPIDRLKNKINQLIDQEEFAEIRENLSIEKVITNVKKGIGNYPKAKKHHMIAEDLLIGKYEVFQKPYDNLTGNEYNLTEYLQETLELSKKPKHVYIVSKFFTSFKKNQTLDDMNVGDYKKRVVFDSVKKLLEEKKVKGTLLSETKNLRDDFFSHKKISMKGFHDRYVIIKSKNEFSYICLSAELDNFDWVDKDTQTIRLRDTKKMRIDSASQLPKPILEAMEGEK